jgi:S-adenosylmethionine:tRNA ribosyltransferase-isomerase
MTLRTADFDYPLPEHLIAHEPAPRRDASRMMVLHRAEGRIEHRQVVDFPSYLKDGDLAIFNNTRVMPARVFSDDRRIELLLLERIEDASWRCLVKPGRRMRLGSRVEVGGVAGSVAEVLEDGDRIVVFERPINPHEVGVLPLPPYIDRVATEEDWARYQTVYAQEEGSVAAPTAGLHFTREMMEQIPHEFVTLHVGVGTFRPVQVEDPAEHPMHSERYNVTQQAAEAVARASRVIAIGTTSVRVLEASAQRQMPLSAGQGRTDLFIREPYDFKVVGAMLTNFHLPKSTLLMLVSAFAGREFVLEAYRTAIEEKYRFFSYGDCMLIL